MSKNKTITLDVSELEAPYPLMQGLEAVHNLNEDEILIFKHRMSPCKLFEAIEKNSLKYEIIKDEENHFEMKIHK
ncbi:MAG: hypothetical protein ACNI28_12835 [Arcobacter sp.]|uniref:hypothetical protein n=1 Tax=Arcobacter sp. TaxID=1872629 RepID=UPI003B000C64